MTQRYILAAALVLAAITVAALLFLAGSPVLYAPGQASAGTLFHLNPDVLRAQAVNGTTDMYPLMQDVLDHQGQVVLSIRLRDMDSAAQDLAEYRRAYRNLDNLVINLDMNESEIKNFVQSSREQDEIFRSLMNDTQTLDSLKRLEIRYRDNGDSDMLVSVQYQGEALRKRVDQLYSRYTTAQATMINTSTKLGLDTTESATGTAEFRKILRDADAFQPVTQAVPAPGPKLTLAVDPEDGTYRDTLNILGVLSPPGTPRPVTLMIDGNTVMNVTTGPDGDYRSGYTIERIRSGNHQVTARSGQLVSNIVPFTVHRSGSNTTLSAFPDTGTIAAVCPGTVTANRPVRLAPVNITEGNRVISSGRTDDSGLFNITVPLAPGTHILRAEFSSPEFPVNPSVSSPVSVTIPSPAPLPVPTAGAARGPVLTWAAAILVILASAGIALLYLRKRECGGRGPVQEEPPEAAEIRKELDDLLRAGCGPDRPAPVSDIPERLTTLLARYREVLRDRGVSDAARQGYLVLAGRVARVLGIPRYRTRTPREMAESGRDEKFGGIFATFIAAYERIRYAGSRTAQDEAGLEERLVLADSEIRGDGD